METEQDDEDAGTPQLNKPLKAITRRLADDLFKEDLERYIAMMTRLREFDRDIAQGTSPEGT